LTLLEEDRPYLVGRAAHCDLPLADADVSREHVGLTRRAAAVALRDFGAKNGTSVAGVRIEAGNEVAWRPAQTVKIGRTLLMLDEPIGLALQACEGAPDEVLAAPPPPLPGPAASDGRPPTVAAPSSAAKPAAQASGPTRATTGRTMRWSALDFVVMAAALGVLVTSLVGLLWLLRR
jgi:pSer/pThr/pTyr-binding forkhead associated (FHA) protein